MSEAISESTGRPYGLQRVCRVWERARSSVYERRGRASSRPEGDLPGRRGPKPKHSDEALLAAIQTDLKRSPFKGEGHRKVHARLRILDRIRVSRKRVLRVMRENSLLSPHRVRQGKAKKHDGQIITLWPNVMWGTDGARVFTLDDGWVWVFSAVEHWNAECTGWHVSRPARYTALQPLSMALNCLYGSVEKDIARGLRMDHGTQYLSDHFLN